MSREISTGATSNISADVVHPFFAVELLFDGANTIRMWTGVGTLVRPDGTEWIGLGSILDISAIEETSEMAVKGATIRLSGVSSAALSLALSEPYQGRVCNIYFVFATASLSEGSLLQQDGAYILLQDGSRISLQAESSDFTQLFSGYMDQMNISENADTTSIELMVENRLIDLERARVARFTSGYQKSLYPGDLGLDFVEDLQDKDIVWGRSSGS